MVDDNILLTVFIPVQNESEYIYRTLAQLRDQSLPFDKYEVIVCDGCSEDNTVDVVNSFIEENLNFNLKCLHNEKRLSSSARNIAVKSGSGIYFLLIDGHVFIDDTDLLKKYLKYAKDNNAVCLGRPQPLNPPDISPFQEAVALARQSLLAHSSESYIYSNYHGWTSPISIAVMYHISIFDNIGYFDESFDAAEDFEFNYRIEKSEIKCFTSPALKIYYYPRDSYRTLFKQLLRYGYGRAIFLYKHPNRLTINMLIPTLFVLTLITILILGLTFSVYFLYMFAGITILYFLVLIAESFHMNLKHKKRYFFQLPFIILTIHFGIGIGLLKGALNRFI